MKKTYIETSFGQIHCRITAENNNDNNTIVCLQPMPFSGLFYDTITPYLSKNHTVISPDYPGYGASDPLEQEISIELWADSMAATIKALDINHACDLIGFHTGCLVATELSLRYPELVKRLLLVDVPYFNEVDRTEMLAKNSAPPTFTEDVNCIAGSWKMNVGSKLGKIPTNRAMAILAEHLRTGENSNFGYQAAFRYDADRLKEISHPTLVIATESGLYEPSKEVAQLIPGCELSDRVDIKIPAFEVYASQLAEDILVYMEKT